MKTLTSAYNDFDIILRMLLGSLECAMRIWYAPRPHRGWFAVYAYRMLIDAPSDAVPFPRLQALCWSQKPPVQSFCDHDRDTYSLHDEVTEDDEDVSSGEEEDPSWP